MSLLRRSRFWLLVVLELGQKYTRALVFGFLLGFVTTIAIGQLYPLVHQQLLNPTQKIGVVGDYTPSTLPLTIQQKISLGLTQLNPDGSAGPGLAQSWETTDSGKTYIFHLRGDLIWSNGKTVTSSDVNYNIQKVTFSVIDKDTLRVTLPSCKAEPCSFAPFPVVVSKPIFQSGLRGFGPYKVGGLTLKGDNLQYLKLISLDKNKSNLEYRFYRNETIAEDAYKQGEIDYLDDLTNPGDLANWGKTTIKTKVRYDRVVALFFNLNQSQFGDKNFRQGLAYAVPKIDEQRAYSPISVTSWAYSSSAKRYDSDFEATKKLLGTSSTASTSGEIILSTFTPYLDLAQNIANNWTSLGIKTSVRVENVIPTNYQVLLSAQDLPPDPDQYAYWHSTQTQTNITGYANVKIDKLLEDGRTELDQTKRISLYQDFQRRLVDDAPAIFLYYPKTYSVQRGK